MAEKLKAMSDRLRLRAWARSPISSTGSVPEGCCSAMNPPWAVRFAHGSPLTFAPSTASELLRGTTPTEHRRGPAGLSTPELSPPGSGAAMAGAAPGRSD